MSDREKQIKLELFLLKIELNSNYGVGEREWNRCKKIFDRTMELRNELEKIKRL